MRPETATHLGASSFMNREALGMLLRSGRFLCFDSTDIYQSLVAHQAGDKAMFDNKALNGGILFKEVTRDEEDDELSLTTRIYFPYDEQSKLDGGESILAAPEVVQKMMLRRGALKENEMMSTHDQTVLRVFNQVPTFDPFLLLSQRRELETERPIDRRFFDIDEKTWQGIRRPVMHKISVLVSKAGLADDVAADITGGAPREEPEGPEAAIASSPGASVANAILNAMWTGEPTPGVKAFISSFRLDVDKTQEILFAWKGINYYEYQYQIYEEKLKRFYRWLGSSDSMPKDSAGMETSALDRFTYRRDKARKLIRATHVKITQILKDYNAAFDAMIDEDSPARFQQFLRDAPQSFITVGLSIGVLAHTANAWEELTAGGRKPLQKSANLEPFYDFIIAVNGQDYSAERAAS